MGTRAMGDDIWCEPEEGQRLFEAEKSKQSLTCDSYQNSNQNLIDSRRCQSSLL